MQSRKERALVVLVCAVAVSATHDNVNAITLLSRKVAEDCNKTDRFVKRLCDSFTIAMPGLVPIITAA